MNKKKMILTSLASVAVLGATFVASQPSVVKADDKPTAAQPTGETKPTLTAETPKTEVEKAKETEKEANAKVDASANAPTNFFFIKFPLQSVFFLIDVINIPQF